MIRNILTNERYIGDAMLGKTFITDCISKRVKKNNGERGQSYVENNHPAIRSASRILVIDGNGIQEEGTHEELMAKGGEYAQLYLAQKSVSV